MRISRLHHITQESGSPYSELEQMEAYCKGGGKCTQLRLKSKSESEMLDIAKIARELTDKYEAQLIINDHLELAKEVQADGVHLGQDDRSTAEARNVLGTDSIVGRTCNTLEQIIDACKEPIDYVGVGPLRFTATKEKLSPTLGFEGFREIVQGLEELKIDIPVIAIGGIGLADISKLLERGVYGVAVASLVNADGKPKEITESLVAALHSNR